MRSYLMSVVLLLGASSFIACAPCPTYCARACDCAGDSDDQCVDVCLDNLDVYTGQIRDERCQALIDEMDNEERCLMGAGGEQ